MGGRVPELNQSHGKFLLVATCCCFFALPAFGQTSAATQVPSAGTMAYDAVSVRPCKTGSGMSVSSRPNRFSGRCTTLWGLMFNAYDVRPNDPIPGLPGWATSDTWDVEATM